MSEWNLTTDSAIASIKIFFENILYYLKILALLALPALVVGGGAIFFFSLALGEHALLVWIPGGLVLFLWLLLCGIALINIWRNIIEHNQYISISSALSKAMESFLSFLGLSVILIFFILSFSAVIALAYAIFNDISFLFIAFITVWTIIGVFFFIRFTFAPTILVLESVSLINALNKSWEYTNGCVLQLFIAKLLVSLPSMIFSGFAGYFQSSQFILSIVCRVISGILGGISTIFLIHYYLQLRRYEDELDLIIAPTQPPAN